MSGSRAPHLMDRTTFVATFGDVFEHSPWVAEAAFDAGLGPEAGTLEGLHAVLVAAMRAAPRERLLALIRAHPDLAGRLALAKAVTADSNREQASAGLDRLTAEDIARFTALNDAYKAKFAFPFIMAVKGRSSDDILAAFQRRLEHDARTEFETALAEIARIVLSRLEDRMSSA